MTDKMPDFNSMSQEEIMAWMESLARRQGANADEFTTAANVDIPEVDPNSVVIDEPGYVPYGEDTRKKPAAAEKPKDVPVQSPPPQPEPEPEPEEPVRALETLETDDDDIYTAETTVGAPAGADAIAWLDSLASGIAADDFEEMDLSALGEDMSFEIFDEPESTAAGNPIDWLESLANSQASEPPATTPPAATPPAASTPQPPQKTGIPSGVTDPMAAGVDPMAWLESLARRQGVKDEELTTAADMDIPVPENVAVPASSYEPYSFDQEGQDGDDNAVIEEATAMELDSPTDWLESLASGEDDQVKTAAVAEESDQEQEEEVVLTDAEIQERLNRGEEIPHEQMEAWLYQQLDKGLSRTDVPEEAEVELEGLPNPDEPPVPADLPDWLLEQVGLPEDPMTQSGKHAAAVANDESAIKALFEEAQPEVVEPVEIDDSDPWVEALEAEYEQGGELDISQKQDWYEQNLSDENRIRAVEQMAYGEGGLVDAALPDEAELSAGTPVALPGWMTQTAPPVLAEPEVTIDDSVFADESVQDWLVGESEFATEEGLPDWLASVSTETELEEVPDWLLETVADAEAEPESVPIAAEPLQPPPPAPEPAQQQPVKATPKPEPRPKPQPAPVSVGEIDVAATLESARSKAGSTAEDTDLEDYELLIRASAALSDVENDLRELSEKQENNPAVKRVLGDALMRQGKLQEALDTYRRALNLL